MGLCEGPRRCGDAFVSFVVLCFFRLLLASFVVLCFFRLSRVASCFALSHFKLVVCLPQSWDLGRGSLVLLSKVVCCTAQLCQHLQMHSSNEAKTISLAMHMRTMMHQSTCNVRVAWSCLSSSSALLHAGLPSGPFPPFPGFHALVLAL